MPSIVEVIEKSSKGSKIRKLDESDGIVGSLEEESDEEDKSELQRAYDQLYKQSYKLANYNVKLGKRLKKAQEEVDSLKKMNEDAQAEISQLKNHQTTLNDKVRFLKKYAFNRDGFKKSLEENFLKLEANLSKSSLTFRNNETISSLRKCG